MEVIIRPENKSIEMKGPRRSHAATFKAKIEIEATINVSARKVGPCLRYESSPFTRAGSMRYSGAAYDFLPYAMMRPTLVRRREIWLPTIWGWFALLLIGAVAIVLVGGRLHSFLAPIEPAGARVLVVEGWMNPEGLDQAVSAFRAGGYERIVTTGGPIERWPGDYGPATFAEQAADYLKRRGLVDTSVTAVTAPASAQDRTFLSAVMVREWAERSGLAFDAFDVFSSGTHARRSRLLYRLAFGPDIKVGVLAARSSDYDANTWWRTSAGARDVLDQAIGLLWVKCFFWPPPPGSHEERWAVPRREEGGARR